jgi:hypothetical protein
VASSLAWSGAIAGPRGRRPRQLGHATASITLDTYGHLFPDELDALAGRLEDARADALASLARTQRGPAVVPLREGAG